jgi:O-antigen/teichoic acid export membrane protein
MLKFGAGVTSANVSSFFSRNMDNVLIGWRWGNHALGLYDRPAPTNFCCFQLNGLSAPSWAPWSPCSRD